MKNSNAEAEFRVFLSENTRRLRCLLIKSRAASAVLMAYRIAASRSGIFICTNHAADR
jgi:hypothetical protein